jgi:hypothetical protein
MHLPLDEDVLPRRFGPVQERDDLVRVPRQTRAKTLGVRIVEKNPAPAPSLAGQCSGCGFDDRSNFGRTRGVRAQAKINRHSERVAPLGKCLVGNDSRVTDHGRRFCDML